MSKIKLAYKSIKNMGIGWLTHRLLYELKLKSGYMKIKFPMKAYSDREFSKDIGCANAQDAVEKIKSLQSAFIFSSEDLGRIKSYYQEKMGEEDKQIVLTNANDALEGKIRCFSKWTADYKQPIAWNFNPVSNTFSPKEVHWSQIKDLSKADGDIKYIWEIARFPHFYDIIKAYLITEDEKYAETYWQYIEDFVRGNPYEVGVHWKCGQEISFRLFAWYFGYCVMKRSRATTDDRILMLYKNIYYSCRHISKNYEYALKSVRNNHSISEACGMFFGGALLPPTKETKKWLAKGKKYLQSVGLRQIYTDGTYIQHSVNYHRLVVQLYSFALCIAKNNGIDMSQKLKERLMKSCEYLYNLQNEHNGRMPNYGSNDGALLFPLSSCDYLDYRPQVGTLYWVLSGNRLFDDQKVCEDLMWYCGSNPSEHLIQVDFKRKSAGYPVEGQYILRREDMYGIVKCCRYKDRPAHADMLHFDLWQKDKNILCDAGTYSYNCDDVINNYFSGTAGHNTILIDEKSQMKRSMRFMWEDWTKGYVKTFEDDGEHAIFKGYHTGYGENIIHERTITVDNGRFVIVDNIYNGSVRKVKIRQCWHFGVDVTKENDVYRAKICDHEYMEMKVECNIPVQHLLFCGREDAFSGFGSLYYGEKVPAYQLDTMTESEGDVQIITNIYPVKEEEVQI